MKLTTKQMNNVGYQPSDIEDVIFLDAVREAAWKMRGRTHATLWHVEKILRYQYPAVPAEVVLEKFKQLRNRGLVDWGTCSCRGDWEVLKGAYVALDAAVSA